MRNIRFSSGKPGEKVGSDPVRVNDIRLFGAKPFRQFFIQSKIEASVILDHGNGQSPFFQHPRKGGVIKRDDLRIDGGCAEFFHQRQDVLFSTTELASSDDMEDFDFVHRQRSHPFSIHISTIVMDFYNIRNDGAIVLF